QATTSPAHGTLVAGAAAGQFIYTAAADYTGDDEFQFAANDGRALSAPARFRLNVTRAPSDLTATQLNWNPGTSFFPGGSIALTWSEQNLGPAATTAWSSSAWRDAIFLSTDDRWDAGDARLGVFDGPTAALLPGESFTRQGTVELPASLVERTSPYYLILVTDWSTNQLDADRANNSLVAPFQLTGGVDLLSPRQGSLFKGGEQVVLRWRDYSSDPAAKIEIAIDGDATPDNGIGHTVLVSNLNAAADGAADSTTITLPATAAGRRFLWAKLTDATGSHFSAPREIDLLDEAYRDVSLQDEPVGGGSYEVVNVEWGRSGDEIVYRVLTNYNPKSHGGGDLYLNIGGDYLAGNGRLVGIAVNDRTTTSGLPVAAGRLYDGAAFLRGTSRAQHPTYIKSYQREIQGQSSLRVEELGGSNGRYLITGSFRLAAVGAKPGDPLQVGWAMYCGNDFGHAENDEPLPDLAGESFARQVAPNERHVRWGDRITVSLKVGNRGDEAAPSSTSTLYLSTDAVIDSSDRVLTQVGVDALDPGASFSDTIEITLPSTPPEGFSDDGTVYVGMVADSPRAIEEQDEANNSNLGDGRDRFQLRIGGPPEFVYVITHGLNLDATSEEGWTNFLSSWITTYPGIMRGLVAGTQYENELGIYTPVWNSASGWIEAIGSAIAGSLIQVLPLPFFVKEIASSIIFSQIDDYLREGAANAEAAAVQIVEDLVSKPGLLGAPSDNQIIHLVGHSRGGAVNARVNQLLTRLGYRVDQYTALDGYSTDWPSFYGFLGDIPITTELVQANRLVNYRVQQPLLAILGEQVDELIDPLWETIFGEPIDTDVLENDLNFFDVRAPVRPGFENILLKGTSNEDLSNHLTVHKFYFESACRSASSERYVLDSALGRALIAANAPALAACTGIPTFDSTPTAGRSFAFPNVSSPGVEDLHTFNDGD
ncbi:MAG TPA: CARDB domain-containing protein, partial [Pirellulaceae bacterium]|nr:CARDB domain-containing protein [Pirellulaceae bacterium]